MKFNFIKFWEFSKANDKGASVRAMADAPFFCDNADVQLSVSTFRACCSRKSRHGGVGNE